MKDDIMKSSGVVIENLNLSFGDTHVLKGVNLNIEAGEFLPFLDHLVQVNQHYCGRSLVLDLRQRDVF